MTQPTTTPPPPPYSVDAQPTNNGTGLAITALVLGCCSVFFFWLYGIVPVLAIVFGGVSMDRSKKAGHKPSGMAVAGLTLGIIFTVIAVLVFAAALSR